MKASAWADPQRQAELVRMAREGLSASEIAKALNAQGGVRVTRNAVIGRAWRTGVTLHGANVGASSAAKAGRASAEARRLNPIHLRPTRQEAA